MLVSQSVFRKTPELNCQICQSSSAKIGAFRFVPHLSHHAQSRSFGGQVEQKQKELQDDVKENHRTSKDSCDAPVSTLTIPSSSFLSACTLSGACVEARRFGTNRERMMGDSIGARLGFGVSQEDGVCGVCVCVQCR